MPVPFYPASHGDRYRTRVVVTRGSRKERAVDPARPGEPPRRAMRANAPQGRGGRLASHCAMCSHGTNGGKSRPGHRPAVGQWGLRVGQKEAGDSPGRCLRRSCENERVGHSSRECRSLHTVSDEGGDTWLPSAGRWAGTGVSLFIPRLLVWVPSFSLCSCSQRCVSSSFQGTSCHF